MAVEGKNDLRRIGVGKAKGKGSLVDSFCHSSRLSC